MDGCGARGCISQHIYLLYTIDYISQNGHRSIAKLRLKWTQYWKGMMGKFLIFFKQKGRLATFFSVEGCFTYWHLWRRIEGEIWCHLWSTTSPRPVASNLWTSKQFLKILSLTLKSGTSDDSRGPEGWECVMSDGGGGGLSTQKMFPMFFFKIITISISDPPPNFWGRWFLPKFFKFYNPTKGSCMPDPMPLPGISLLNFYKRREVVDVLRLRIFHFLLWFWICLLHTW